MTRERILRPNGKVYRARLDPYVEVWEPNGPDDPLRVAVLRTRDVERALPLAQEHARREGLTLVGTPPVEGWWRETIRRGERCYEWDELRGVPSLEWEVE